MGLPTEDNFHGYEQGSLLRKAKKLSGKRLNLFLAHGMADTNVHLQNSMVLAKELVRHNVTFQQQVIKKKCAILFRISNRTTYFVLSLEYIYPFFILVLSK